MVTPPAWLIAGSTFAAGIAWLVFARSQRGRWQGSVLGWLSLPFFAVSLVYGWFAFADVPIDLRMTQSRIGVLTISVSQALILLALAFIEGRRK
jgi:hypothetical protein